METPDNGPKREPSDHCVALHETDARLPKILRFTDLARCGTEVWIEHEGQLYRLQRTRQGKLILTK